jgi:hypothetical protein
MAAENGARGRDEDDRWKRARNLLLVAIVAVSAALRLRHCVEPPVNTGDVVRHLLYGILVGERGLQWAGVPLAQVDPSYASVSWAGLPYNYPILALLFFTAVASVWPSILAVKLALSAVEAANAVLVARLGGSRWLGVAYWAYPASIWWVSREAQFEPLQNLSALLALAALPASSVAAAALLGLAVQTKVTAVLLLPFVLARAARRGTRSALAAAAAFAASFLPTLVSLAFYPSVEQVVRYSRPMRYNPYFWNVLDPGIFLWNPRWLVGADAAASWALIAALGWGAARARSGRMAYLAPLAFAIVLKVHVNVQFWYWLTMPVFLLPIPNRRLRLTLLVLLPLVDVYAAAQLVHGPFGYVTGSYYGPPPVAATPSP